MKVNDDFWRCLLDSKNTMINKEPPEYTLKDRIYIFMNNIEPDNEYNKPFPVILSSPDTAKEYGPIQDGWHTMTCYWLDKMKAKKPIPVIKYLD